ncbi:hypothetical protein [Nonomuraea dietziae]|uniref:hypothetical protein n=1 Tax=Nonomuraea dietziae TaxID=65515 RepID=UPI0031D424B4
MRRRPRRRGRPDRHQAQRQLLKEWADGAELMGRGPCRRLRTRPGRHHHMRSCRAGQSRLGTAYITEGLALRAAGVTVLDPVVDPDAGRAARTRRSRRTSSCRPPTRAGWWRSPPRPAPYGHDGHGPPRGRHGP